MAETATEFTAREEEEWSKFKVKFNRKYPTPEEEQRRKLIFVATFQRVEAHNKLYDAGKVTFTMGINQFADKQSKEVC